MKILESNPVPVVLQNLWGSYFSRIEEGQAMVRPFRRGLFSHVGLAIGAPIDAAQVTPGLLQRRVGELLDVPLVPGTQRVAAWSRARHCDRNSLAGAPACIAIREAARGARPEPDAGSLRSLGARSGGSFRFRTSS